MYKIRDKLLACCWFVDVYSEGCSVGIALCMQAVYVVRHKQMCVCDMCNELKETISVLLVQDLPLKISWASFQWCWSLMNNLLFPLHTHKHTDTQLHCRLHTTLLSRHPAATDREKADWCLEVENSKRQRQCGIVILPLCSAPHLARLWAKPIL